MNTNNFRNTLFAIAFSALCISPAFGGEWEVWTEKQGADRLSLVTSFSGDTSTEEAHIDLSLGEAFEVIDAQVLQKGAVCVASAEKNMVRSVPPSGAGSALKSKATDACMFTLRVASAKGWAAKDMVSVKFKECVSSVKGEMPCGVAFKMVK